MRTDLASTMCNRSRWPLVVGLAETVLSVLANARSDFVTENIPLFPIKIKM